MKSYIKSKALKTLSLMGSIEKLGLEENVDKSEQLPETVGKIMYYNHKIQQMSAIFAFYICTEWYLSIWLLRNYSIMKFERICFCPTFISIIVRELLGDSLEDSFKNKIEQVFNGRNIRIVSWIDISDADPDNTNPICLRSSYKDIKADIDKYINGKLFIPAFLQSREDFSKTEADYRRVIELERAAVPELKFEDIRYLVKKCEKWYLPCHIVLDNFQLTPNEELFLKRKLKLGSLQNICMFQLASQNSKEKIMALPSILRSNLNDYKIMLFRELCTLWREEEASQRASQRTTD